MPKKIYPSIYKLSDLPEFQRFQGANPDNQIDEIQAITMYGRAIHWLSIIGILCPDFESLDYYSIEVKHLVHNDPDKSKYPTEFYVRIMQIISNLWQLQLEELFPQGKWSVNVVNDPEITVEAVIQ